jgi:hypothetical protein
MKRGVFDPPYIYRIIRKGESAIRHKDGGRPYEVKIIFFVGARAHRPKNKTGGGNTAHTEIVNLIPNFC